MLISLLALLMMAASTAVREAVADLPVVLEGPTTLELALIGTGVLVFYAVASRAIWRRRERISTALSNQARVSAEQMPRMEEGAEQERSRGAA